MGAEQTTEKKIQGAAVLIVLVFAAVLWASCSFRGGESGAGAGDDAKWADEAVRQPQRRELIDQLIERGVFREVEFRSGGATIVIGPAFATLDFEAKQDFTNVVWSYLATEARDEYVVVQLREPLGNKQLGQHSVLGLKID